MPTLTSPSNSVVLVSALITMFAMSCPEATWAQGSTRPGLRVGELSTVFVRDQAGQETRGKLLRLDDSALVILVDGTPREFELSRVSRVQKRGDSLRNGALIGSAIGFGLGLLVAGEADCRTSSGYDNCGAGPRTAFALMSTAVYGLMGAGIDALIQGRTTIYESPRSIAFSHAPGRIGANVTFRW